MIEVLIFIIAFSSAFIGLLIPGVASALSVSSLILVGIPIQLSKVTYQLGNLGINLWALVPLFKTQKLRLDLIFPLSIIALAWGYIGWKILIEIPWVLLLKLTWGFMITLLVINLLHPSIWTIAWVVSKRRKLWWFFGYFILNIIFSILPMGTGILFQFLHTFFFRVTNLQARLMWCFLTTPFVLWFIFPVIESWIYNIRYALIFWIWWYLGWYLWAKSGIKLGNHWLRYILIGWLFLTWIYFIFFA